MGEFTSIAQPVKSLVASTHAFFFNLYNFLHRRQILKRSNMSKVYVIIQQRETPLITQNMFFIKNGYFEDINIKRVINVL